jgi:hypothetical protein
VRIVFAIDAHDPEMLAWHAVTGAGANGSMVRDLMLEAVVLRFATIQTLYAASGCPITAVLSPPERCSDFAAALALVPCFTPMQSPEFCTIWR